MKSQLLEKQQEELKQQMSTNGDGGERFLIILPMVGSGSEFVAPEEAPLVNFGSRVWVSVPALYGRSSLL